MEKESQPWSTEIKTGLGDGKEKMRIRGKTAKEKENEGEGKRGNKSLEEK